MKHDLQDNNKIEAPFQITAVQLYFSNSELAFVE